MADELPLLLHRHGGDGDDNDDDDDDDDTSNTDDHDSVTDNPDEIEDEGDHAKKVAKGKSVQISYDLSLPTTHSYLGSDLEELSGRTIHDDDTLINLPLLHLPGVVLVPGQTVPLTIFTPQYVSMMNAVLDVDKTFGLVTSRFSDTDQQHAVASVGTTAEIFSIKNHTDDRSGITTLKVIAKGRQRFEILETRHQINGNLMGKVRIMRETELGEPLANVCRTSLQKFARRQDDDTDDERLKTAVDRYGHVYTSVRLAPHRGVNKFTCTDSTWWPAWVYKMYDTTRLMKLIKHELFSWNDSLRSHSIPSDPSNFSFWIAQNLPVDDSVRLGLLSSNCPVQRLRSEYSILKNCTSLCCQNCQHEVAITRDVFSLSIEGPMGAYVNPHGYVHDIVTVTVTRGIQLVGHATTENSWFPGFAWTIAQCKRCSAHMGWRFTAVNKSLSPAKFFGLCRASLSAAINSDTQRTHLI